MSPVTTTALGKQARTALERVRKEIASKEKELEELRSEEARVQRALEALQETQAASGGSTTARRRPAARSAGSQAATQQRKAPTRRRRTARKSAAKSTAGSGGGVSAAERQKQMIDLLSKRELTREELAQALGVSKVRVGQLMESLIGSKKVVARNDPRAKRPRKLFRAAGSKPTVEA